MRIYRMQSNDKKRRITVRGDGAVAAMNVHAGRVASSATTVHTTLPFQEVRISAPRDIMSGYYSFHSPHDFRVQATHARRPAASTVTEWLNRNPQKLNRYAGKWVAVTPRGIIAHADDFDSVWEKAQAQGVESPTVFKLPKPNAGPKAVSGKRV